MSEVEFNVVKFLSDMALPPGSIILLLLAGLTLIPLRRTSGYLLSFAALLSLYLCSIPLVSSGLMTELEPYPALVEKTLGSQKAQAIVVLAGGRDPDAAEYGDDTVSYFSLQRARYAAWLHRRTHLPLIVSGGITNGEKRSEADLIRQVLEQEFDVSVEALEEQSKTTYFNAKYTSEILKKKGYKHIFLVTHAWHMPRAVEAFQHFDIDVIPAPTAFEGYNSPRFELSDIVPDARALYYTVLALHEMLGRWWYQLRYYDEDKADDTKAGKDILQ